MSLQTPSDIKVKEEDPVEVDSSPPASPDSISSMSDSSKEPVSRGKVHALCKPDLLGQNQKHKVQKSETTLEICNSKPDLNLEC